MARSSIPDALRMQILKYGDGSAAERDRVVEQLQAAGRRSEVLLLLETRPEHPLLGEEAAWAVTEGRGFHLLAVRRIGWPVSEDQLRACARAAESRARWLDARLLYEALGDPEAVRRIAEHLPPSLRPEPELEAEAETPGG